MLPLKLLKHPNLLLISLIVFTFNLVDAKTNIDSVKAIWYNQNLNDSIRTNSLKSIAWNFYYLENPNSDSMFLYANQLKDFSDSNKDSSNLIYAIRLQGSSRLLAGNKVEAFKHYNQALELAQATNNFNDIAACFLNIGAIYFYMDSHQKALECYQKSLEYAKKGNNKRYKTILQNSIATIYDIQGQKQYAEKAYKEIIENSETESLTKASALKNLGALYHDQNKYRKSLTCFTHALEIYRLNNSSRNVANCQLAIGSTQMVQGNYTEAQSLISQAISEFKNSKNQQGLSNAYREFGYLHEQQNDILNALTWAEKSMLVAQTNNIKSSERKTAELLSRLYEKNDNHQDALEMYKRFKILSDSLRNNEIKHKLSSQQNRIAFEQELKAQEQEKLDKKIAEENRIKRRNYLQYSLIGISLLVVFIGIYFGSRASLPNWIIKLAVFLPLLLLFEFIMVVSDPFVEEITSGVPFQKLIINGLIAALIFPLHHWLEAKIKSRFITKN